MCMCQIQPDASSLCQIQPILLDIKYLFLFSIRFPKHLTKFKFASESPKKGAWTSNINSTFQVVKYLLQDNKMIFQHFKYWTSISANAAWRIKIQIWGLFKWITSFHSQVSDFLEIIFCSFFFQVPWWNLTKRFRR